MTDSEKTEQAENIKQVEEIIARAEKLQELLAELRYDADDIGFGTCNHLSDACQSVGRAIDKAEEWKRAL